MGWNSRNNRGTVLVRRCCKYSPVPDIQQKLLLLISSGKCLSSLGKCPWLDKLLHKNPSASFLSGLFSKPSVSPVLGFALKRIAERENERHDQPEKKFQEPDFLSRFLDVKDSNPSIPDS